MVVVIIMSQKNLFRRLAMLKLIIICAIIFLTGCASMNQITREEQIIDAECALKNSVPDIHDEIN